MAHELRQIEDDVPGDSPVEAPPRPADLTTGQRAVSAVRWTVFGSVLQRLATLAAVAILARLLTQTEYGAYRQLLALHLILFVLLPLGFDQLYIREVARRDHFARLLTGALVLTSLALALVMIAGHGIVASLMDFHPWNALLWLTPAIVLVQAWKLYYKTGLAAQLNYRPIALGETMYAVISGGGAVALALAWPHAASLYIAYGIAEITELIWLRRRSAMALPSLRPALATFRADAARWKRFGLFHCGTQALNAVGGNAPVLIFGSMVSKASAAAFSMAHYLVTVPIFILIGALHRVAYSALAGRTPEQLTSAVLRILALSAAFIAPVLIYVAVLAEPLVHIALGHSWVDSTAPVVRWVSIYCIWVALFSPVSSLDLLLDRPDYGFWWNVAATVIRVAAVVAGLQFGVMHAVAAYATTSSILWLIWGIMLARLLGCGQARFHITWARFVIPWIIFAALLIIIEHTTGQITMPLAQQPTDPTHSAPPTAAVLIHPLATIAASTIAIAIYTALIAWQTPEVLKDALKITRKNKPNP